MPRLQVPSLCQLLKVFPAMIESTHKCKKRLCMIKSRERRSYISTYSHWRLGDPFCFVLVLDLSGRSAGPTRDGARSHPFADPH